VTQIFKVAKNYGIIQNRQQKIMFFFTDILFKKKKTTTVNLIGAS
jgi:hypothetical protein